MPVVCGGREHCLSRWDVSMLFGQVKQASNRDVPITAETLPGFGLLTRIKLATLATPAVPEIACPGLLGAVECHPQHEPGLVVRIVIRDAGQRTGHTGILRGVIWGGQLPWWRRCWRGTDQRRRIPIHIEGRVIGDITQGVQKLDL